MASTPLAWPVEPPPSSFAGDAIAKPPPPVDYLLRHLVAHELPIALPGAGATMERFRLLAAWGARDLSLARLAEGHVDAVAIRAEAGMEVASPGTTYGVWASRSHPDGIVATRQGGGWVLSGTKEFCSGAGTLDRALVTAEAPDGYRLFDVDLSSPAIAVAADSWQAVGMAESQSATVHFDGVRVNDDGAVGPAGFYIERPGFWFGGVGVAACWFGGAQGLVTTLINSLPASPSEHVLAAVGRSSTALHTMTTLLNHAARHIDDDPTDQADDTRQLTLMTREAVHGLCVRVLELTASAGGARPLGHDGNQARRAADLYVYLSQHHGDNDAAHLGRMTLEVRS